MAGILSGIVKGLTAGVEGYADGQREVRDKDTALAGMLLQRQQQAQLTGARVHELNARSDSLEHPKPDLAERLHSRVAQLVNGGMSLEDASAQARKEYGQQNTADPTATHAANRTFDVRHPLPARAGSSASSDPDLARATRVSQTQARADRSNATAAERGLANDFYAGAPAASAYPDNHDGYAADSSRYATAQQRVHGLMATADSSEAVAHRLTDRLTRETAGDGVGGAGAVAPRAPAAPRSSKGFTPSLLPQHQKIDRDMTRAIQLGADPAKAGQRASQLHQQLEQQTGQTTP